MEIHRMYYMHSLIQALGGRNGFKQQNVRPPWPWKNMVRKWLLHAVCACKSYYHLWANPKLCLKPGVLGFFCVKHGTHICKVDLKKPYHTWIFLNSLLPNNLTPLSDSSMRPYLQKKLNVYINKNNVYINIKYKKHINLFFWFFDPPYLFNLGCPSIL